jgi:hypothetical protein
MWRTAMAISFGRSAESARKKAQELPDQFPYWTGELDLGRRMILREALRHNKGQQIRLCLLWLKLSDAKRKSETGTPARHYQPITGPPAGGLVQGKKDEARVLEDVKSYGIAKIARPFSISPNGASFVVTGQAQNRCFKKP